MSQSNKINQTKQDSQAQKILDSIKKHKTTGDVIIDEGSALSLKANKGELEEYKVSSSQIFGVRVIKDNKVGTAYSEASDDVALELMVEQAIQNAGYSQAEPLQIINQQKDQLRSDDSILYPEDNSTVDEKIAFLFDLEAQVLAGKNIQSVPHNGLNSVSSSRSIYTSSGLTAFTQQRYSGAYAYALAKQGDKNTMQGHSTLGRQFSQLDLSAVVNKVLTDCQSMLLGKPIPSKKYDVIFDKEMITNLFAVFAMAINGRSAKDGVSPWREKVGQQVANNQLTILDNPLNKQGFAYQTFDAEGFANQSTSIIENGELKTLLHNSVTAKHFNVENTFNASRGPKSTLGVRAVQMEIKPGDGQNELYEGEYLLITELTGMHSGANAISGDFSFGASGYLNKDGERIQAVRGITVAGNFYQMLNNIKAIGNIQKWNCDKTDLVVDIRFADLSVSGE